ncbi:MAG TPA: VWA domain-containing protein, partial [Terriglobia bacterium]
MCAYSRPACLVLVSALFYLFAAPYSLHPATPQQSEPLVRVETQLVLVDVVATDKKGAFVSGLSRESFSLKEEGKQQQIEFFSSSGERSRPAPPPLPPHVFTNRPEYHPPEGPLTIVLLDSLNTPRTDQAYVRLEMLRFVAQWLQSGQRTAILLLTDRLHVLQDFTIERRQLLAAVEKFSPQQSAALGLREAVLSRESRIEMESLLEQAAATRSKALLRLINSLRHFDEQVMVAADRQRAERTLAALRVIAESLAGYPGRKNLIWLSGAFPLGFRTSFRGDPQTSVNDEFVRTVRLLNDARIAFFPVDPRGLTDATLPESYREHVLRQGIENQSRPSSAYPSIREPAGASPRDPRYYLVASQQAMKELAAGTGGRAFYNRNDVGLAVAHAIEEGSSYYTLGYYPGADSRAEGFRGIEVKGPKGVELRHRRGYFRRPPPADLSQQPQEPNPQLLLAILHDPLPATSLTFRVTLQPPASASEQAIVETWIDSTSFTQLVDPHFSRLDLQL